MVESCRKNVAHKIVALMKNYPAATNTSLDKIVLFTSFHSNKSERSKSLDRQFIVRGQNEQAEKRPTVQCYIGKL